MEPPNQDPTEGPFEVVFSDLSTDRADETEERAPSTRRVGQARLSRRARARRIMLVASTFLVLLVVILGSQSTVRNQMVSLVQRFIPTPTPTLPPSADRFYLTADVPWTTITLDGQPLHPPRIGVDAPLHLARGRHTLVWRADPFLPQQCRLDVPPTTASTCPIIEQARQGQAGPLAWVVALHESLNTLAINQLHLLTQTIQMALSGFSDIVQSGEAYFDVLAGDTTVTQPIRATLSMYAGTDAAAQQACTLSLLNQFSNLPCAVEGQNCAALCPVSWQDRQTAAAVPVPQEWLAFAVIYSVWDYTTLDGRSIVGEQPLDNGRAAGASQLVLLRIGWDGSSWHVQPLFGPEQGAPIIIDHLQIADDPGCLAAEDVFSEEIQNFARLRFVSGPNPAVGCLVEAAVSNTPAGTPPPANAPVAYWLVRFGVFLAVNDLAHTLRHEPLADAYELQLAQQLAALPGGLIATGQM